MKKMKKMFLPLALIIILFNSCSSDDADSLDNFMDITGTWDSTSFISNEPLFDVNEDGINSLELLDELPCRYSKLVLNEDLSFYQENNSWNYNENSNEYNCSSEDDISNVNGTWTINSDFTLLSLNINDNIAFLEIEFDGDTMKFNSSESFLDRNAQGELNNIYGKVLMQKR